MSNKSRFAMSLLMMTIMACNNTVTQNTTPERKSGYNVDYTLKSDCYYGNCYGSPDPYASQTPDPYYSQEPTPEPTVRPIPDPESDPEDYDMAKYLDVLKSQSDEKNKEITDRIEITRKKISWLRNIYSNQFTTKASPSGLANLQQLESKLRSVTYAQGCRSYYSFGSEFKKKNKCDESNLLLPNQLGSLLQSNTSDPVFSASINQTSSLKDDLTELIPTIEKIYKLYDEITNIFSNNPNGLSDANFNIVNGKYKQISLLNNDFSYREKSNAFYNKLSKLSIKSYDIKNNADQVSDNYFDDSSFIQVPKNLNEVKQNIQLAEDYFDDFLVDENTYGIVSATRVLSLQYKMLVDLNYGYLNQIIKDIDQNQITNDPNYPVDSIYKVLDVVDYVENKIKKNEIALLNLRQKIILDVNDANAKLENLRNNLNSINNYLDQIQQGIDKDKNKIDSLLNKFNAKIGPIPENSITPGSEAEQADVSAARADAMIGQLQTMIGGANTILNGAVPNGGGGLKGQLENIKSEIRDLNELPLTSEVSAKLVQKRSEFADVNAKIQEMESLKNEKSDILKDLVEKAVPEIKSIKSESNNQNDIIKKTCNNAKCRGDDRMRQATQYFGGFVKDGGQVIETERKYPKVAGLRKGDIDLVLTNDRFAEVGGPNK